MKIYKTECADRAKIGWRSSALSASLILAACSGDTSSNSGGTVQLPSGGSGTPTQTVTPTPTPTPSSIVGVAKELVTTVSAPWAFDFLPDGRFVLTERASTAQYGDAQIGPGKLWLVQRDGQKTEVSGLPANNGLLDIRVAPDFATSRRIYVSYFEPGGPDEPRRGRGASDMRYAPDGLSVFRAVLSTDGSLSNVQVIWRQEKIVPIGINNQQGGYMAFSPDGRYLFIAAGVRDEFDSVQNLDNALGKILRIYPDGTIPTDNPYAAVTTARKDIWATGVRNPYGLAFDPSGVLWEHENGPMGGDEVNLVVPGNNYGWPKVSNGRSYGASFDDIPDHRLGDGYAMPTYTWYTSVAPSGLLFYKGTMFAAWKGEALLGTLKDKTIIRMHIGGGISTLVQEITNSDRVRTIREAPDGALWLAEDQPSGKVYRLTPVFGN